MPALLRILAAVLVIASFTARAGAREFDLKRDTFAFSNDTVFAYGVDEQGKLHINARDKPAEFGHRCFVLARGVLQFHQFARFAPEQPRVSREEYRRIVRQIFRIPVWSQRTTPPIVVPGFRDVHTFSIAYEGLLKETLGNWFPTYMRVGNWRMAMGYPRCRQVALAKWLVESVEQHKLRAIYLARFPWMNHVVVVYDLRRQPSGDLRFIIYDPNYPNAPSWVDYHPTTRSFEFQTRWYFPGGHVNAMRVFTSPLF